MEGNIDNLVIELCNRIGKLKKENEVLRREKKALREELDGMIKRYTHPFC